MTISINTINPLLDKVSQEFEQYPHPSRLVQKMVITITFAPWEQHKTKPGMLALYEKVTIKKSYKSTEPFSVSKQMDEIFRNTVREFVSQMPCYSLEMSAEVKVYNNLNGGSLESDRDGLASTSAPDDIICFSVATT